MSSVPSVAVVAVLAGVSAGCATIDYVGETYPPTSQVDVYFSEYDVGRPFEVIGEVLATGDQFLSASRLQKRMTDRARELGADAVIIQSVQRVRVSDVQRVTETVTESTDDDKKKTERATTIEDVSAEGSQIRARFVRYRPPEPPR